MSELDHEWAVRLAELRRAFDESFTVAASPPPVGREAYLVVRVGADRLAIALRALGGITARRAIVPLPAEAPALMGVIGHRARPVPVYALGPLLGRAAAPANPWILLTSAMSPVGLAVDAVELYLEVPSSATVRDAAGPIEVVDVASLTRTMKEE